MGTPDQSGKLHQEGVEHMVVRCSIVKEEERPLVDISEKRVRLIYPHGLGQEISPNDQSHCACGDEPGDTPTWGEATSDGRGYSLAQFNHSLSGVVHKVRYKATAFERQCITQEPQSEEKCPICRQGKRQET